MNLPTSPAAPDWFAPCADLVDDLTTEQRARILAVTHSSYLEGIKPTREVVERMAAIERGTITAADAVAELFARYEHPPGELASTQVN